VSARALDVALPSDAGVRMYGLVERLYPICRSITGDGVRQTLDILGERLPLQRHEVPTGQHVLDWTVPMEWNVRGGWVRDARGKKLIDFERSNLHVMGYSAPIRARVSRAELLEHLHTLPEHPHWIPYRNSFYREGWGFCTRHAQLAELTDDEYEVCIDSSLEEGHLSYGELAIAGRCADEVLVWTHVCHPSLCNDNLSGIAVAALLAETLLAAEPRYSYRFVFAPSTIGAITWLARNEERVERIRHGLVLACVGDAGRPHYMRSRRGNAAVDRAVERVLAASGRPYEVLDFSPYGYDQRQFCSPGFDLPVGCFMRTPNGRFPEYHSSADDLDLVRPEALADSAATLLEALTVLEGDGRYLNQNPKGEPQLGRRGLYEAIGGRERESDAELALLWVLNFSDGRHSLLDIAERSGLRFRAVRAAADALLDCALLVEAGAETGAPG
jgi:aminopeptidase-like protein